MVLAMACAVRGEDSSCSAGDDAAACTDGSAGHPIVIGVDVGGTNTDCAVLRAGDTKDLLGSRKVTTTSDVTSGMVAAIRHTSSRVAANRRFIREAVSQQSVHMDTSLTSLCNTGTADSSIDFDCVRYPYSPDPYSNVEEEGH